MMQPAKPNTESGAFAETWSMHPCPAKINAVLGFPKPTLIPCGLVEGHDGWHRYGIEWLEPAGDDETPVPAAWQDETGDLYCAAHKDSARHARLRPFTAAELATWTGPLRCDFCGRDLPARSEED